RYDPRPRAYAVLRSPGLGPSGLGNPSALSTLRASACLCARKTNIQSMSRERSSRWLRAALIAPALLASASLSAWAAGSDHVPFIDVPPPAVDTGAPTIAVPGGPGQLDVTKPYYYNPPPQSLSNTDQLQLKAYRDQLYWQQRELELQQSQKVLTPNQQQRLYQ